MHHDSAPETVILFGIGNPLLDIAANVPASLLEKYSLKPANAILAGAEHLPLYEELTSKYGPVEYVAGGAAQNSIRCAQWLLARPKSTVYVGSVGKDDYATQIKKSAEKDGVTTFYHEEEGIPTGKCAVLITEKERSMVAHLAAAEKYKFSHFESKEIQALVHKAQMFYATSFFLTVCPESLIAIGKHAVATNKPFLYNLAAPFLIEFFADQMASVVPYADFVFCNETEAAAYGKKHGYGEDLKVIAQKVEALPKENKKRPRFVCFTQGPKEAIVAYQGKIHLYKPIPLAPEKIVDLNGAGDAFVGGFLARYAIHRKLDVLSEAQIAECMEAAAYCASEIIQVSGINLSKTPKHKYEC